MKKVKDTSPKRILREIKRFNDNPQKNIISFHIQEKNILKLIAKIIVTDKCPYKGGKFDFEFEFCHDYPFKPPKIKLINKIYHPNFKGDKTKIYHYSFLFKEENVPKFDILGYNWSPDKSIIDILKIIYQVLTVLNLAEIMEIIKKDAIIFTK